MRLFACLLLTFASLFTFAQETPLPVIGKIDELKTAQKVYVAAQSTNSRKMIAKQIGKDLTIVDDPKDAQFVLEYVQLSRQDKTTLVAGSYTEEGEMRAWLTRADGTKVIAWSDTETYYESSGMPTGRPNEVTLTKNFLKALKKARK